MNDLTFKTTSLFCLFFNPDRYCVHAAYDKLVPWKIRLHGAIDGGSHFVVGAKVATNKRAETIFAGYAEAVQKYGHPLRIRSDFASEHVLVEEDINRARPGVYRAYLTGSSVHNQVGSLKTRNKHNSTSSSPVLTGIASS